jgi:uncharacterized protein (TIGR02453 family)
MMHAKLDYVFEFLEDLSRHNTREWMHTRVNERRFDVVQRTMLQWVAMLLLDMQDIEDTHGVRPKDCMYRVWRDTRFSDDKTPCKTYLSFLIRSGGRRNDNRAAYYLQIGPGGQSFIAGGVYMPDSERLKRIRTAIVEDGLTLHRIVQASAFRKLFGGLEKMQLKTMPRDFRKTDYSPEVRELLRCTSWVATRELSDGEVLASEFDADIIRTFAVLKPLNTWLNVAMSR